ERCDRHPGRVARTGDIYLPASALDPFTIHGPIGLDHGQPHRPSQREAIRGGPHIADVHTVAIHDLGVEHQWLWVGEQDLHEPAPRWSCLDLFHQGLAADEATGLGRVGELAQADLPETIGVVDVVAVVAVALRQPERAERFEPGMPETEILSGLPAAVVEDRK